MLFASNNNKAVDVVRERMERFEEDFPIAVRAGAKQKQNIQEILRRTLNMACEDTKTASSLNLSKLKRRRKEWLDEREALKKALESGLHQRIPAAP